jgi:hypothetical protein
MPDKDGNATAEEIAEAVAAAARIEQLAREAEARRQAEQN